MASNPYQPGTPEWQQWMNKEIAEHDREQRERDAKIDAELRKKAQEEAKRAEEEAKRNKDK